MPPKRLPYQRSSTRVDGYETIVADLIDLIEAARRLSVRAVNAVMTATYWEIGRRIVESEQRGEKRAEYGEALVKNLALDLTNRFGRGFSLQNLYKYRQFFLSYRQSFPTASGKFMDQKFPTASGKSIAKPESAALHLKQVADRFPLSWSHYVRLLALPTEEGRHFYETEALRCGWSVRQLDRQISSQFYERTALSRNKVSMLRKAGKSQAGDLITPEEEIKDPFILEFLGLKDEYSESEFEEALIFHLESFLLELGGDFAFIGRQRRLRIGDEWYRVDLLFFHRKLRCLIVIDIKLGRFKPDDVGQMHAYLNYAKEHWVHEGENPPVGVILCAQKNEAVAHYALEGLDSKVLAREYRTVLPSEKLLAQELEKARKELKGGPKS